MLDIVKNYNSLKDLYSETNEQYQLLTTDYNILIRENTKLKQEVNDLSLLLQAKIDKYNKEDK